MAEPLQGIIMSRRDIYIDKLNQIIEQPQNCFDKEIRKNRKYIEMLPDNRLSDIYALCNDSRRLCKIIPYSKKDVFSMVESGEVSPYKKIASLYNNYIILEKILCEVNGKEF